MLFSRVLRNLKEMTLNQAMPGQGCDPTHTIGNKRRLSATAGEVYAKILQVLSGFRRALPSHITPPSARARAM
jgi:hypothetical protein